MRLRLDLPSPPRAHLSLFLPPPKKKLLLQDFIKWRGLLLHRFILCAVDDDAEVSALARFLLTGPLASKQPALLSHAPVDLLFSLHGFEEHPKFQALLLQGSEGQGYAAVDFEGVALPGDGARAELLAFICGALSDEQRIEATARLAHEVLAPAADGSLPCDHAPRSAAAKPLVAAAPGFAVLRDALLLLASPELRVGRGASAGDAVSEEEMASAAANGHAAAAAAAGIEAAKGRLLSKARSKPGRKFPLSPFTPLTFPFPNPAFARAWQMSRKQLMEHVVPIVLSLKRTLEAKHSPLLRHCMAFLAELARTNRWGPVTAGRQTVCDPKSPCLWRAYPCPPVPDVLALPVLPAKTLRCSSEVRAVLSAVDPVLAKEVDYDLKQYDKAMRADAAAAMQEQVRPRRLVRGAFLLVPCLGVCLGGGTVSDMPLTPRAVPPGRGPRAPARRRRLAAALPAGPGAGRVRVADRQGLVRGPHRRRRVPHHQSQRAKGRPGPAPVSAQGRGHAQTARPREHLGAGAHRPHAHRSAVRGPERQAA